MGGIHDQHTQSEWISGRECLFGRKTRSINRSRRKNFSRSFVASIFEGSIFCKGISMDDTRTRKCTVLPEHGGSSSAEVSCRQPNQRVQWHNVTTVTLGFWTSPGWRPYGPLSGEAKTPLEPDQGNVLLLFGVSSC
jgi:hypothetical protein